MATHSSTLAWKIPWTEEPGRLQSMGRKESDTTEQLHFDFAPFEEHERVLEEMMFRLRTEEVGQQMGVTFFFLPSSLK